MTKADIVDVLHEKGYLKSEACVVVDDVFEIIRESLTKGDPVQIRGFGTFDVKVRKGRRSRDISTGEMRVSNDRNIPAFHPSNSLKEAVR